MTASYQKFDAPPTANASAGPGPFYPPPAYAQPQHQYPQQPQYAQQPMYAQQPVYTQQVVYMQGADSKAEDTARLLFIIGLFFGIVGWVNVCMHCGHSCPAVKKWAKYSAITEVIKTIIIIAIVVVQVTTINSLADRYPN